MFPEDKIIEKQPFFLIKLIICIFFKNLLVRTLRIQNIQIIQLFIIKSEF